MELPDIVNKEYFELIAKFKPVFGNPNHIEIAQYSERIEKKEKLLKRKQSAVKSIPTLEDEITRLKAQALHLLKNY